ncbi:endo alpha-1,4 polygalactosaminidase [Streptomyces sp. NPDC006733]|uniref:endo alpha-1,4 polygalactosaminidase n=1 Tax=Streptomyces sp. NPDC006733 TaxID=3155460 RepID=UPI00340DA4F2
MVSSGIRALGRFAPAALAAVLLAGCASSDDADPPAPTGAPTAVPSTAPSPVTTGGAVALPPAHAGFDYQIGGAYPPPEGVRVVVRDREAAPAAGVYTICYVNAFQAQPGAEGEWDADLLLRSADRSVVVDRDWNEALLDLSTADKRQRVAAKVGGWIDGCAAKGFRAIEPDNFDSYTRSQGLLTEDDAQAFVRLLSAHAHARGLAIGQKNTAELAAARVSNGLDFAVAEECGALDECAEYTAAFGSEVLVIEYTEQGLAKACAGWGGRLSVVRRDRDVTAAGGGGYLRQTC